MRINCHLERALDIALIPVDLPMSVPGRHDHGQLVMGSQMHNPARKDFAGDGLWYGLQLRITGPDPKQAYLFLSSRHSRQDYGWHPT